jgi:dihydrolipoamide dehydrogenase
MWLAILKHPVYCCYQEKLDMARSSDTSMEICTEVAVIGGGPGGYVAAIRLAQYGKKVVLIEQDALGGVCLNWGCIPSKAMIEAGRLYQKMQSAKMMGIIAQGLHIDMPQLQQWKFGVVNKLTRGIAQLLKNRNIQVCKGTARFETPTVLQVSSVDSGKPQRIIASHFIIATGSVPVELPGFPVDGHTLIGSKEALSLPDIPESLLVVGGGVIGLEMGTLYARLGTRVTVVELAKELLPDLDPDIRENLCIALKQQNITVYPGSSVTMQSIEEPSSLSPAQNGQKGCAHLRVQTPDRSIEMTVEKVLVCTGRQPNTLGLGLENIGLSLSKKGFIHTDQQMRTNIPHIFAVGDVTAPPLLAHKASKEGLIAAAAIAGKPDILDYRAMPSVIFCDPEIATVGLTEAEALAKGYSVKTGSFPFSASGRALTLNATSGMIKLVTDAKTGIILGVHMIGNEVSELISEATLAIEMGATAEDLALTIHAHPTLPESLMEAAEAVEGMAIHIF